MRTLPTLAAALLATLAASVLPASPARADHRRAPADPPAAGGAGWQDEAGEWQDEGWEDAGGEDRDGGDGEDRDRGDGDPESDRGDGDPESDRGGWAAEEEALPPVRTTMVRGKVARMRTDGKAAIPRGAPKSIRRIISAANRIVGKPYKWGGGHAKLVDRGYDCSGAVSYPLITTGMLNSPLVSGGFARWGERGEGRWLTIYANESHVYMEIAGLRLDTSAVGDDRRRKGVRWRPAIGRRDGFHVRHPAGL